MTSKQCTKCKEFKDLSEFYKNAPSYGDGYRSRCKSCISQISKTREIAKRFDPKRIKDSGKICLSPVCQKPFWDANPNRKFCSKQCSIDYTSYAVNSDLLNSARSEFVADLKRVYELLGRPPTINEYNELGEFADNRAYKLFGSFYDACKLAGFSGVRENQRPTPSSPQDIIDDINILIEKLGRFPTTEEYNDRGAYSLSSIKRLFGSFHRLKSNLGYGIPESSTWNIEQVSVGDGHWLSGFVEGEGSFHLSHNRVQHRRAAFFDIGQRNDRVQALYEVCRIFGLPCSIVDTSKSNGPNKSKVYLDSAHVKMSNIPLLFLRVRPVFDKFALRGKKRDDYLIWRTAVYFLWNKTIVQGKTRWTEDEDITFGKLAEASSLIKEPNVTLDDIKHLMPSWLRDQLPHQTFLVL